MEEPVKGGGVATSNERSFSSEKEKQQKQQQDAEKQETPDFQLTSPSLISPFLRTFLHRFSELFPLVSDDTFMDTRPHGKRPKHLVEALWLKDVLEKCSKEIEEQGSFLSLSLVVSDHEVAAKRVPESIEHIKTLNAEMHSLRQQIQAEDLAHKEAVINWNKTLLEMKQGIKDLKAQNKLTAKYRADMAVAQADCKQRLREEKLSALREEINRLTNQVEVEKRVNVVCMDFLKKQNLTLMEEAISLATGHENDVLYMDVMLNKLRDQKLDKENLLSELEPRYMAEMSKVVAEKQERERQETMSIDELRKFETQTRAVIRIQRVWRGHMDRAKHTQELKKIAKKRKELRNKSKKEKKDKQGKEDGKKGGGKKNIKNKK